jgi:hypothetical protein
VNNENYEEIVAVIKHTKNILINQYVRPKEMKISQMKSMLSARTERIDSVSIVGSNSLVRKRLIVIVTSARI